MFPATKSKIQSFANRVALIETIIIAAFPYNPMKPVYPLQANLMQRKQIPCCQSHRTKCWNNKSPVENRVTMEKNQLSSVPHNLISAPAHMSRLSAARLSRNTAPPLIAHERTNIPTMARVGVPVSRFFRTQTTLGDSGHSLARSRPPFHACARHSAVSLCAPAATSVCVDYFRLCRGARNLRSGSPVDRFRAGFRSRRYPRSGPPPIH